MRRSVLLILVACASSASPAVPPTPPEPTLEAPVATAEQIAEPHRALTAGEIAMVRPIFRDGIDYAKIRVVHGKLLLQPKDAYMTVREHVYAPGGLWQDDFSKTGAELRATFVHELTHVWQHANGMDLVGQSVVEFAKHRGDYEKAYPYKLERGRDLADYGMEQQASIVEDYYLVTVTKERPNWMTNRGITSRERDRLFATVLGKFLGNAKYARALDANDTSEWRYQPNK